MNLSKLNTIGSGAGFPVKLSQVLDSNGDPIYVDGIPSMTWGILEGDVDLIRQNLTSILIFQIGQRFRQENFGTRIWECLEEPNNQAAAFLVKKYIEDGITAWEPRINSLEVTGNRDNDTIYIHIRFKVNQSQSVEELNFEYNPKNNLINAY